MELLGTGWRKVIHAEDKSIPEQILGNIAAGRGGVYRARNVSKMGDVFGLLICAVVIPTLGLSRGTATLEDYWLNRKHFPITRSIQRKG